MTEAECAYLASPIRPGVHLSHAARLADDAQRLLISAVLHAEVAGFDLEPAAYILEDVGDLADELLAAADAFAHGEVERIADSSAGTGRRAA